MVSVGVRLAVGGAAAMLLAGCSGSPQFGTGLAAKSQDFTVTQQHIADEVAKVQEAAGSPAGEPPVGLAYANVQRIVQDLLVAEEAQAQGVSVTPTEIERGVADLVEAQGGQEQLQHSAAQAGVPLDAIDDVIRTQLLIAGIGRKLAPTGDENVQAQATRAALTARSEALDVEVAPRYGTWDHAAVGIGAPNPVVQLAPVPVPDFG